MIMKWRFTLVALLFCAVAAAQGSLEVKAEREEDNSVRIWADKTRAGKCTVVLKYRSLNNCANYGDGIYTVAGGSENLVLLRPINSEKQIIYDYTYSVFYGDVEAEPDTTFVYRLPVSAQKSTRRRNVVDIYDRYLKNEERQLASSVFDVEATDTIYIARKGVVVKIDRTANKQDKSLITTTERATVTVEHADGSYAFYRMLDPNSISVRVGQTVYPDTPIGRPWSFNGEHYLFFFSVADYVWIERGKKTEYKRFTPLFKTDRGVTSLQHDVEYRAVVDDELIEREMSGREKRHRKRQ